MGTHRCFRGGGLLLALLAATSAAQHSRPASRPFVGAGALLAWSDVEPEAPQPHVLKAASAAEAWRPRAVRRGASRARAVARTDRARILVDVEAGAEGGLWLYDLDGAPPRRLWPDADAFVAAHGSVAVVAQAAADGGCSFSSIPLDDPAKARTLDLRLPGPGRLVAFDGLDPFDRRRSPLSAVAPSSFTALDGAAFAPSLPLPWEPPARTYRDLQPSSNGAFVACVTERYAAPGLYGGPAVVDLTLLSVDSGRRVAGFDLTPTYAPINPLSSHVRTYRAPYVRWLDADLVEFDRGFAPKSDNGMSAPLIERVRARLTADGAVVESATVAGDVEPPPPPERRYLRLRRRPRVREGGARRRRRARIGPGRPKDRRPLSAARAHGLFRGRRPRGGRRARGGRLRAARAGRLHPARGDRRPLPQAVADVAAARAVTRT
jgi:hypothetical protein